MTKQKILSELKNSWKHCKRLEKDKEHQEKFPGVSYNYGWIMETVRRILKEERVWNDQEET